MNDVKYRNTTPSRKSTGDGLVCPTTSNTDPNRKDGVQLCRTMETIIGRGAETNNKRLEIKAPIFTKQSLNV